MAIVLASTATLATCLGAAVASPGFAGAASAVQPHKVVLTNTSSGTTTVATKGEVVVESDAGVRVTVTFPTPVPPPICASNAATGCSPTVRSTK